MTQCSQPEEHRNRRINWMNKLVLQTVFSSMRFQNNVFMVLNWTGYEMHDCDAKYCSIELWRCSGVYRDLASNPLSCAGYSTSLLTPFDGLLEDARCSGCASSSQIFKQVWKECKLCGRPRFIKGTIYNKIRKHDVPISKNHRRCHLLPLCVIGQVRIQYRCARVFTVVYFVLLFRHRQRVLDSAASTLPRQTVYPPYVVLHAWVMDFA